MSYTRSLLRAYRDHMAHEPPPDAGNAPMVSAHEETADRHRDWDRTARAWRTLLAPLLLADALEALDGPHTPGEDA